MATEHDNENGPCACGAWHHPGDAEIVGGRWTPCAFDANPDRRVPRWPDSAGVGPGEHAEASACGKRPADPVADPRGMSKLGFITPQQAAERVAFLKSELAEARLAAERWKAECDRWVERNRVLEEMRKDILKRAEQPRVRE